MWPGHFLPPPGNLMNPSGAPAHLQFQQRQGPVQHQMPPHMMGQPMGHMMAQPMMAQPHLEPKQVLTKLLMHAETQMVRGHLVIFFFLFLTHI